MAGELTGHNLAQTFNFNINKYCIFNKKHFNKYNLNLIQMLTEPWLHKQYILTASVFDSFRESMPNVCIVGNSMPKVGGSVEPGKDTDR